jgi:hypothetical protein
LLSQQQQWQAELSSWLGRRNSSNGKTSRRRDWVVATATAAMASQVVVVESAATARRVVDNSYNMQLDRLVYSILFYHNQ